MKTIITVLSLLLVTACGRQDVPALPDTTIPSFTIPAGVISNDPVIPSDPASPVTSIITYYALTKTKAPISSFPSKTFTATANCAVLGVKTYCWDDGIKSITAGGLTTNYTYFGIGKNANGTMNLGNTFTTDFLASPLLMTNTITSNLVQSLSTVTTVLSMGSELTATCTTSSDGKIDCGNFIIDTNQPAL